jgi:hypothetical protein
MEAPETLEEDLRRLKEAAEKQRLAKDRLIQTQQDAIDELGKQRLVHWKN